MLMKRLISFIDSRKKVILQVSFGMLFILLGVFFLKQQRAEMSNVREALIQANPLWLWSGVLLLFGFVLVQGLMYVYSFRAIHQKIGLFSGTLLYLKRNLISVFLPAGMLTNMAFFNKEVERKEGVSKTQIYFASSIFSFCSIATGILLGLPALVWLYFKSSLSNDLVYGFVLSILLIAGVAYLIFNLVRKGKIYRFLERKVPFVFQLINDLKNQTFDSRYFWLVVGLSLAIELIGIVHLFMAAKAVGASPTVELAVVGYSIVVLILSSSPFLRGKDAIEVALTYALTVFGFDTTSSISTALIFRFFEFWEWFRCLELMKHIT